MALRLQRGLLLAPLRSFGALVVPAKPQRPLSRIFSTSTYIRDEAEHPAHFKTKNDAAPPASNVVDTTSPDYMMPHPIWSKTQVEGVKVTHIEPEKLVDKLAYWSVQTVRQGFDTVTGFKQGMSERNWLIRLAFLETVAGVPGFMGAMVRHLSSLRRMGRDHGWIHTLLEDAENERMHLLFVMELLQPSFVMRMMVLGAQGVFANFFFLAYLVSPRYCHRFVGYLEEEAVSTYEKLIKDIEHGSLATWNTQPAPDVARKYWRLPNNATVRDVIYAIRADEAHHRTINHTLANLKSTDANPFPPGRELQH